MRQQKDERGKWRREGSTETGTTAKKEIGPFAVERTKRSIIIYFMHTWVAYFIIY